jgi:hypothetical protein
LLVLSASALLLVLVLLRGNMLAGQSFGAAGIVELPAQNWRCC